MNKSNKFSPEVSERAVRMVQEHRGGTRRCGRRSNRSRQRLAAYRKRCSKVKRVEVDAGIREGVTTSEAQRVKDLEREVKELRRANEPRVRLTQRDRKAAAPYDPSSSLYL